MLDLWWCHLKLENNRPGFSGPVCTSHGKPVRRPARDHTISHGLATSHCCIDEQEQNDDKANRTSQSTFQPSFRV
eukprot:4477076-Amphidinium_carterae.1